jgi:hypothetical protein
LPHSETPGSPIARISPGLFAACHVLHRLSVPRHPPDALLRACSPVSPTEETAPPPRTGPNPVPASAGTEPPRKRGPIAAVSHEDTSRTDSRPKDAGLFASVTSSTLSSPFNQPWRRARRRRDLALPRAPLSTPPNRRCCLWGRNSAAPVGRRRQRSAGGGGERTRTDDLLLAKQALSQLSYTPVQKTVLRNQ